MSSPPRSLPIVDVRPLVESGSGRGAAAAEIGRACRQEGFFYVVGHGVDAVLQRELEGISRRFFDLPLKEKLAIRMELGGAAWRGYFPVGAELTAGRPDHKEGLYFGAELPQEDPKVRAGTPLFGANLFPDSLPEMRPTVLAYLEAMTRLGQSLLSGIALSLGLPPNHFSRQLTAEPTILFRIFHYPPLPAESPDDRPWSVGEHTDYGLLTLLLQDDTGGLEVRSSGRWIQAPPVEGSLVCNIGDMLDRMTAGLYRSTPHRVRNPGRRGRLSFPFFFDPGFDAEIRPIDTPEIDEARQSIAAGAESRWDSADLHSWNGTYGEYLLAKVGKVFPGLGREHL